MVQVLAAVVPEATVAEPTWMPAPPPPTPDVLGASNWLVNAVDVQSPAVMLPDESTAIIANPSPSRVEVPVVPVAVVVTADSVVIVVPAVAASPHVPVPSWLSSTSHVVLPLLPPTLASVPVTLVSPPAATPKQQYRETDVEVSSTACVNPPGSVNAPVFLSPARNQTSKFPAVAPLASVPDVIVVLLGVLFDPTDWTIAGTAMRSSFRQLGGGIRPGRC